MHSENSPPERPALRRGVSPSLMMAALLGAIAFVAALATIQRPGLTVDEPINVGHGKAMVHAITTEPSRFIEAETVFRLWNRGHEHPPLSRLLVGWSHWLFDPAPANPVYIDPQGGRPASALALALLVALATRFAWSLSGPVAGTCAGISLLLMPRLFAHGRLASPEVISSCLFLLALMAMSWALEPMAAAQAMLDGQRPRYGRLLIAGVALGTALLTKLTVALLPIAVIVATLLRLRRRAIGPLLLWSVTGSLVFWLCWPWLWPYDFPGYPAGWLGAVQRLREYLFVGIDRPTVYVWYFGKQYPNAAGRVPWTFVWIFFAVTVPVGLQAIGLFFGLPRCWQLARERMAPLLVLVCLAVIGVFFSLPIERYDGERLFLMAFPLWGIVIGVGCAALVDWLSRWAPRKLAVALTLGILAIQSGGVLQTDPFQLSYYNALIGGPRGAEQFGLEATYWGDSITTNLLERFSEEAGAGECAGLFPTLYAGHAFYLTSPGMRAKEQSVLPGDQLDSAGCGWAILFNRQGYVNDPEPTRIRNEWEVVAEESLDGVWLARVYRRPQRPAKD